MSIEPELHATSDAVLATLDRLRALELEKRDLPVGSPRLVELAKEIERLATSVLGASDAQVDLAKAALAGAEDGTIDASTTINEMGDPPRTSRRCLPNGVMRSGILVMPCPALPRRPASRGDRGAARGVPPRTRRGGPAFIERGIAAAPREVAAPG